MEKQKWSFAKTGDGLVLDIGICGAGIAGLAAAAALVRLGHNVEVFERSKFKSEVGAALGIGPNVTGILDALGLDYDKAGANSFEAHQIFDATTLKLLLDVDTSGVEQRYGSKWYSFHRVNLHRALKELACEPPPPAKRALIRLGVTVSSVDPATGIISFADGTQVKKDVIIGADGMRSTIAPAILHASLPPLIDSHQSAYRFTIPTQKLFDHPLTAPFFQSSPPSRAILRIPTTADRRLISYPCDSFQTFNFALLLYPRSTNNVAEPQPSLDPESWHNAATIDDLLAAAGPSFHPALQATMRMAEDLKLWKLYTRDPLHAWSKGRVVLVGDAAHPMLPHQAQAANMALEDVGALAMLLANVRDRAEIPLRLGMLREVRGDRASAMQIFSNAPQDQQGSGVQEKVRRYFDGSPPRSPVEFQEFSFGYDLLRETRRVMAEAGL